MIPIIERSRLCREGAHFVCRGYAWSEPSGLVVSCECPCHYGLDGHRHD